MAAIDDSPDGGAGARRLGAQYRIDFGEERDVWWIVGWDRPLGTYYGHLMYTEHSGVDELMVEFGAGLRELRTIGRLEAEMRTIGRLVAWSGEIPEDVCRELKADAAAFPYSGRPPRFYVAAESMGAVTMADPWYERWRAYLVDDRHGRIERTVAGWSSPDVAKDVEPRSSLPAGPVVGALVELSRDHGGRGAEELRVAWRLDVGSPGAGAEDGQYDSWAEDERDEAQWVPVEFAASLGMDQDLAEDIVYGQVEELDAEQIDAVCQALRCSPFDLWGSHLARGALGVYPPERWPQHIAPLDGLRHLPADLPAAKWALTVMAKDQVVAGLRAAQSGSPEPDVSGEAGGRGLGRLFGRWRADQMENAPQPPNEDLDPATTVVTAYAAVGFVHCSGDGTRSRQLGLDGFRLDSRDDFHLRFRQANEPAALHDLALHMTNLGGIQSIEGDGIPAEQISAAYLLRHTRSVVPDVLIPMDRLPAQPAELIRFTSQSGEELWLISDDRTGWARAQDPRAVYPGNPDDVLDKGVLSDPVDVVRDLATATPGRLDDPVAPDPEERLANDPPDLSL